MAAPADADRERQLRAIGALLWKDPQRILETAAKLRGTDAVLECRLRGGSMGAAIPAGAAVRIAVGGTAPPRVGDVVAFLREDGLCIHRVAHSAGPWLVTQGDACFHPDAPIGLDRVLGPVVAYSTGGTWRSPVGGPAGRSQAALGRALLRGLAGLLAVDVRLARAAARVLRLRREGPNAEEK